MSILNQSKRIVLSAAVLGALVIAPLAMANNGKDYDSQGVRKLGSQLSVQINDNGSATVRGAKVTSINGSTIVAATSFGSTSLSWNISTNSSTEFYDKGNHNSSLASLHVGDVVSFRGSIDPNVSSLTVIATVVKDWSVDNKILEKHVFEGKLPNTIGSSTLPTSFSLTISGSTYTVKAPLNTPILSKNWATTNLGLFLAGDTVRVYGSIEATNLTTIDAVVIRDATR